MAACSAWLMQPVSAAGSAVEIASVSASAGEEVAVPVTITENAGIIAMGLRVRYDASVLTLSGVDDSKLFADAEFTGSGKMDAIPYHLSWVDALTHSNYTNTGTLAVLHFKVSDTAADGFYEIGLEVETDNTFDVNINDVPFAGNGGGIKIGTGDVPVHTAPAGNSSGESYANPEQHTTAAGNSAGPQTDINGSTITADGGSTAAQTVASSAGAATDAAQSSRSAASSEAVQPENEASGINPLWVLVPLGLLAAGVSFFVIRKQKNPDGNDGNA